MLAHKNSHLNDDIIKIGKVRSGNLKGTYRPHEHYFNKSTGSLGFGPGATLEEIIYPPSAVKEGKLTCRKCNKYEIAIDLNDTLRTQAIRVAKFRNHESICKH